MTGSRFDLPRAQIRYAPWRGRRGSSTREGVGVIGAERLAMGGGVLVTAALVVGVGLAVYAVWYIFFKLGK